MYVTVRMHVCMCVHTCVCMPVTVHVTVGCVCTIACMWNSEENFFGVDSLPPCFYHSAYSKTVALAFPADVPLSPSSAPILLWECWDCWCAHQASQVGSAGWSSGPVLLPAEPAP